MKQTVFGIFSDNNRASDAINALKDKGYNVKDISVITKDRDELRTINQETGAGENQVVEGATSGAVTGGAIGALAGLLIGIGAITIPGIGALLVGGPIVAALGLTGAAATTASGAITGALAGGLVGALVGLGVPEEDAKVYEQRINEGATLLAIPTRSDEDGEVDEVLQSYGADQIKKINLNSN